jgi:hypothetical protein
MPYRRLPKTDAARLKALRVILDNDDVYTGSNRVIDWKILNRVQPVYDHLFLASQQYMSSLSQQMTNISKVAKLKKNAELFLRHFVMVLYMSVERGEIKKSVLPLYGLTPDESILKNLKFAEFLAEIGSNIIAGEKERLKNGGLPIYNPSIAKVAVHYDIFYEAYQDKLLLQQRTEEALTKVSKLRTDADDIILSVWNAVEKTFETLPPEKRYEECRKYGVVYYYRRNEPHIY